MPPEELKIRKNFIDFNGTKKYYNAPCLYWKWDLPELCYKSWYEKKNIVMCITAYLDQKLMN